jgi:hypothetical protein
MKKISGTGKKNAKFEKYTIKRFVYLIEKNVLVTFFCFIEKHQKMEQLIWLMVAMKQQHIIKSVNLINKYMKNIKNKFFFFNYLFFFFFFKEL